MRVGTTGILVILVAVSLMGLQALYVLDVTEQAIITQFGQYKRSVLEPGLHVKTPFLEEVTRLDKRVLRFHSPPLSILTSDKKNLVIDAYARYRIVDPLKVFQTVRNEAGVDNRVGAIISGELKKEVASHTQSDIISKARERLMAAVTEGASKQAREFGIELLDVRIVRADFPPQVVDSIYGRMRAEREREAKKFRAEGGEEELKIKAEADKKKTIILAEARKQSEILRGEGESEAIRIYAEALEQDPEFYTFLRSLDAYKEFLKTNTTVVLSSESELFRYLETPAVGSRSTPGGGR
ncbi:MAG: protease modulator HflC [Dehalococcoidia bacterium]|nr:protease modulator HflC [Dehalococcoidia bacterium]